MHIPNEQLKTGDYGLRLEVVRELGGVLALYFLPMLNRIANQEPSTQFQGTTIG